MAGIFQHPTRATTVRELRALDESLSALRIKYDRDRATADARAAEATRQAQQASRAAFAIGEAFARDRLTLARERADLVARLEASVPPVVAACLEELAAGKLALQQDKGRDVAEARAAIHAIQEATEQARRLVFTVTTDTAATAAVAELMAQVRALAPAYFPSAERRH